MAKALKLMHQVWAWLARYGAERAPRDRRVGGYVARRRREVVRRAAGQIGIY
jgi:hypothetical protein